jgi:hypothetical protein
VPRLTELERHRVNEAKTASEKALGKSAGEVRNKHDKELAEKISAKSGTPFATALRLVKARHRGVLYPDVELEFDHLGVMTVGAVLADADRMSVRRLPTRWRASITAAARPSLLSKMTAIC